MIYRINIEHVRSLTKIYSFIFQVKSQEELFVLQNLF